MRNFFKPLFFIGAIVIQCNLFAQVVDPVLASYVESFQHEARIRGFNYFKQLQCVKFPTPAEDSVFEITKNCPLKGWDGVAITYQSGEILVFINQKAFDSSDAVGKEMIVFHELLHGYFTYPHVAGCPLMREGVISGAAAAYYRDNKKEVLDQVFNRIKK